MLSNHCFFSLLLFNNYYYCTQSLTVVFLLAHSILINLFQNTEVIVFLFECAIPIGNGQNNTTQYSRKGKIEKIMMKKNKQQMISIWKLKYNGVIVYIMCKRKLYRVTAIQTLTVRLRWISIWPHNLMEYNLLGESFYCALATNHPENKKGKQEKWKSKQLQSQRW